MSFCVVILSARAANLAPCVRALRAAERDLDPARIIVVDDGARAEAEPQLPGLTWIAGERPFIFARNANLGIAAAGQHDVVLLNDDARLLTPGGFSRMARSAAQHPEVALLSAAVRGAVANARQRPAGRPGIRIEPGMLAFVCVYIPRRAAEQIGPLDERFTGYGYEDDDYCARALACGWKLGVCDGCVVEHGTLPSTYRTRPDVQTLFAHNRRLFEEKRRAVPAGMQHVAPQRDDPADWGQDERQVDLLYLAFNRLAFTRETFTALLANTDWSSVRELVVYDDGSEDGADAWLAEAVASAPAPARFERTRFRSPVAAMSDFIRRARAPILAKVDSDAMMPPGWLCQSLNVLDRHPELDLLGIEAMNLHSDDRDLARGYTPAEFVSGLGLYRRAAFARSQPRAYRRYFGLEEWQTAHKGRVCAGWINPGLPVFLLDRMPLEPWASLSADYVRRGWQRHWPSYDPQCTLWRWRWPDGAPADFAIAPTRADAPLRRLSILADGDQSVDGDRPVAAPEQADRPADRADRAARRLNLQYCDDPPLLGWENVQVLPFPGAGDLDLRVRWPWNDDAFAQIRAADIVEHLPEQLHAMNELWRVLTPGGEAEIVVPTTDGSGAFQDPTHVSFWNRCTFRAFEAGRPERERLIRRVALQAAFQVLREHTEVTADGPRLTIALRAVKLEMPALPATVRTAAAPTIILRKLERPRFLCALRIKNEAAWIGESLDRALRLCGRALVFDDCSTDETPAICRSFGERVTLVESPFTGLDEARDKNAMLRDIIAIGPEWVLWIDGDEVLELAGPRKIQQAMADGSAAIFSLRIAYLWDRPDRVRTDGIWGRFYRPSLFRLAGQPLDALTFAPSGAGANFHCGNVPRGLVGVSRALNVRLKHYGYLERERRQAKYRWYNQHDPNNLAEDCYRHLAEIPGARHAPGPPRFVPWREERA